MRQLVLQGKIEQLPLFFKTGMLVSAIVLK